MTKHTPGPWEVLTKLTGSENHKGFRLWADRGWIGDLSPCDSAGKIGLANARLIAAAPDLLEALEKCEALLSQEFRGVGQGYWPDITPTVLSAREVIKKARGE